jgi:thioester reductase-like protein
VSRRDDPRRSSAGSGVLLTGATGFLGRRILADLLRAGEHVGALVRAQDADAGRQRIAEALATVGLSPPPESAMTILPGALDRPGLGLSEADREHVIETCGSVLHCGASVRFDLALDAARAVNVEGTRALLELARARAARHGLRRFDFVGTAFVAGGRDGIVLEDELDPAVHHRNTYEQSKFEAEQLVRQAKNELPVAVYRPTIVTPTAEGDARSPIDWPVRIYASGLWRTCPGHPEAPIDLVPVGFVCEAIRNLRQMEPSLGRTFHLAAGVDGAITLGEAAALSQRLVSARKSVRFVDPERWGRYVHPLLKCVPGSTGKIARKGENYLPYFVGNPLFDNSNTRSLLAGTGVDVPNSRDVLEEMLAGALRRRLVRRS